MREVKATGDFIENTGSRVTSFASLKEALHAVLTLAPGEQVSTFSIDLASCEWSVIVDQTVEQ